MLPCFLDVFVLLGAGFLELPVKVLNLRVMNMGCLDRCNYLRDGRLYDDKNSFGENSYLAEHTCSTD